MSRVNLYQPMPPIFSAGITWDTREPLPKEYEESSYVETDYLEELNHLGPSEHVGISDFDLVGRRGVGRGMGIASFPEASSNPKPPGPTPSGSPHVSFVSGKERRPLANSVNFATTDLVTLKAKPGGFRRHVASHVVKQGPERSVLPPASISIKASIIHDTARVAVTQIFLNDADVPIPKGSYTFPLPNGCSVGSFDCQIGDKKLTGTVKPREAARHEFNEAVRAGKQTGLLEQGTPEIFTASLGNIPPNTEVTAEITLTSLLKHRFLDKSNIFTFTIPTCIAERYGPRPENVDSEAAANDVKGGLSIQVDITQAEKLIKIISRSHTVTVDRDMSINKDVGDKEKGGTTEGLIASVTLQNNSSFLDKDFVLDIETKPETGIEEPQAWLEDHPRLTGHQAMMLTIPPRFMARATSTTEAQEIIFLADRSGSMGDKIAPLKSAMAFFLKGIPVGKWFNLWCFGSRYESLWPTSMKYSSENLQRAQDYVSEFHADMGGTELLHALQALVKTLDSNRLCDIIILTDGEVWRLEQTLDLVQQTKTFSEGRIRFFSLGIGHNVSHALVEGIAKSGGGYSEVIQTASEGGWEDRVVAMLKATLSKHIGPLHIDLIPQANKFSVMRSPADIFNNNPFQPGRIYMLFDKNTSVNRPTAIIIKTEDSAGEELLTEVPIHHLLTKDTTIHSLGARAILEDLENGTSEIHLSRFGPPRGSTEERRLVQREAEKVACMYSLISKWTSFLLQSEEEGPAEDEKKGYVIEEDALSFGGLNRPYMSMRESTASISEQMPLSRAGNYSLAQPTYGTSQSNYDFSQYSSLHDYSHYYTPSHGYYTQSPSINVGRKRLSYNGSTRGSPMAVISGRRERLLDRQSTADRSPPLSAPLTHTSAQCFPDRMDQEISSATGPQNKGLILRYKIGSGSPYLRDSTNPELLANSRMLRGQAEDGAMNQESTANLAEVEGEGLLEPLADRHVETLKQDGKATGSIEYRYIDSMPEPGTNDYSLPHRDSQHFFEEPMASPGIIKNSSKDRDRAYYDYDIGSASPNQGLGKDICHDSLLASRVVATGQEGSIGGETLSSKGEDECATDPLPVMSYSYAVVNEDSSAYSYDLGDLEMATATYSGDPVYSVPWVTSSKDIDSSVGWDVRDRFRAPGGGAYNESETHHKAIDFHGDIDVDDGMNLPGSAGISTPLQKQQAASTTSSPQDIEKKKFLIHSLNKAQEWDGSFKVTSQSVAKVLGGDDKTQILSRTLSQILSTKRENSLVLLEEELSVVAKTIVILLALERYFSDLKDLWEMMHVKGMEFLKQEFEDQELVTLSSLVQEWLRQRNDVYNL